MHETFFEHEPSRVSSLDPGGVLWITWGAHRLAPQSCQWRKNLATALDRCIGYLEYPFKSKQGKSCLENLSRHRDTEQKIGPWSSSVHFHGSDIQRSQHTSQMAEILLTADS